MSNTISLDNWLQIIDAEYLSTFVRYGGASVKFAVTPDELKADLYTKMEARGRELDHLFVNLDAALARAPSCLPRLLFWTRRQGRLTSSWLRRFILRLASDYLDIRLMRHFSR